MLCPFQTGWCMVQNSWPWLVSCCLFHSSVFCAAWRGKPSKATTTTTFCSTYKVILCPFCSGLSWPWLRFWFTFWSMKKWRDTWSILLFGWFCTVRGHFQNSSTACCISTPCRRVLILTWTVLATPTILFGIWCAGVGFRRCFWSLAIYFGRGVLKPALKIVGKLLNSVLRSPRVVYWPFFRPSGWVQRVGFITTKTC